MYLCFKLEKKILATIGTFAAAILVGGWELFKVGLGTLPNLNLI